MRNTNDVLQYLVHSYLQITGNSMIGDEVTAHKLMYYAQKTSIALTDETLFDEEFEGWVHGPVLPSLRGVFDFYQKNPDAESKLDDTAKFLLDNTIHNYGRYATWKLRDKSHEEKAWIKSREGLDSHERGSRKISIEDMREDAKSVRVYDHQYDMYIDEFEDLNEDFISAG